MCGRLMSPAQETQSMREIRLLRGRLPQKGEGLTGIVCCHFLHLFKTQIIHKTNPDKEQMEITIGRHFEPQPIRGGLANELR